MINALRRGIPFFFKQWGGVRKKAAGRALDGQTYDGFPARTNNPVSPVGTALAWAREIRESYAVSSGELLPILFDGYRIFLPNAEHASSTARSAVRLCSSMTGLTSTISKLSKRPWSARISMARWASR